MDPQLLLDAIAALVQSQAQLTAVLTPIPGGAGGHAAPPAPKISVHMPIFKGEPNENVMAWLLQCHNIFHA